MEDSCVGGPFWSRSVETSKEDVVERVLKSSPPVVGTGAVEATAVSAKIMGVFMEVLKNRIRFKELVSEYLR